MRFWLTLGVIVLIGFFCFRSCAAKFIPDKKEPGKQTAQKAVSTAGPPSPAGSAAGPPSPAAAPVEESMRVSGAVEPDYSRRYTSPVVSEVYVFRNRLVPAATNFITQGGVGNSAAVVTVDEPSNSILIRGPIDAVRSLKIAAKELDLESGEAYCDAWMLFVRGDKVRNFEASLEYSGGGFLGDAGGSYSTDGFGVSVPLGTLRAKLQIMASNGLLEVVDRPQLRLSSGHRAEVSTGEEVPFPTTVIRDGVAFTSIEFKRVGLLFAVEPLFLAGGRVRMDVTAENGLLGATRKVGDVEVPSITRQSVKAAATLGYDDAMIIGGLETVRREKRFGLFGQKETAQSGRLYVALMLRSGYPRAKPVIGPAEDFPLLPPVENGDPGEYGDRLFPDGISTIGGVLPEYGWENQERDFLKTRRTK